METKIIKDPKQGSIEISSADRFLRPCPEHKLLKIFIGKWNGEGQNEGAAPILPGASITTTDSYEWLPGRFFILHRGIMRYGNHELEAIKIIGYDATHKMYTMDCFDSMGVYRRYLGTAYEGHWKFTGEQGRVRFSINENLSSMNVQWEIKDEDLNWQPLCVYNANKTM